MSVQPAAKTDENPYDQLPYESLSYPLTQPPHLFTVATLMGLAPPNFMRAKVLEIGCACGGNLMPVAYHYPESQCLGIDLSQEQIAVANAEKAALGLKNVEFRQQDIMDFSSKEKFDYIICHGIFSWVPESVRLKTMDIIGAYLAPNGIAVVSYNALPGWNLVRGLREMMLHHTHDIAEPVRKVAAARQLLDFLAENVTETNVVYRGILNAERNNLRVTHDAYLFHDHLEGINNQFYFHEFMKVAAARKLQYVGDIDIVSMFAPTLAPKAAETLKSIPDLIQREQYMDFISNRRFRSTILCREGLVLERPPKNEQILDYFLLAHPALKASETDPEKGITFTAGQGTFNTHDTVGGVLILELIAAQKPVAAEELVEHVAQKLNLAKNVVRDKLVQSGLPLAQRRFIELFSDCPPHVTHVSEKPVAFPIARYQAGLKDCRAVTTVLGTTLRTGGADNLVIHHLDGTRTAEDIVRLLEKNVKDGTLRLADNTLLGNDQRLHDDLSRTVTQALSTLAKYALLVG